MNLNTKKPRTAQVRAQVRLKKVSFENARGQACAKSEFLTIHPSFKRLDEKTNRRPFKLAKMLFPKKFQEVKGVDLSIKSPFDQQSQRNKEAEPFRGRGLKYFSENQKMSIQIRTHGSYVPATATLTAQWEPLGQIKLQAIEFIEICQFAGLTTKQDGIVSSRRHI